MERGDGEGAYEIGGDFEFVKEGVSKVRGTLFVFSFFRVGLFTREVYKIAAKS